MSHRLVMGTGCQTFRPSSDRESPPASHTYMSSPRSMATQGHMDQRLNIPPPPPPSPPASDSDTFRKQCTLGLERYGIFLLLITRCESQKGVLRLCLRSKLASRDSKNRARKAEEQ